MAFPQTPLDVDVELQIGGVWTDVTSDVYLRDRIQITRGRADEGSRPDPGKCTLTLNNRGGKYSPRNPTSPYYGQIGRNTPLRVSVPTGTTYLSTAIDNDRATTPDTAVLDITGDLDIRIDANLENWRTGQATCLAGKYGASGQRSWLLYISSGGQPILQWTADGSTVKLAGADSAITVPGSGRLALRCTLDVNDGAGGHQATFYTSDSISGTWTQLGGAFLGVGTTSVFASTAVLEVGDVTSVTINPPIGQILAFQLRNGIAGSVVANPDFTAQTSGATSFVDSAGLTWSTAGTAAITNRRVRFVGEVSSWPPRWDVSGQDVWTPIEAAGITRRLGQGASPLDSALRRAVSAASPTSYWPLEDDRDATQGASAISEGAALTAAGLTFANLDTISGSTTAAGIGTATSIAGTVATAAAGQWRVEMAIYIPTAPTAGSDQTLLSFTSTGTVTTWRIGIDATAIRITGSNSAGTLVVNTTLTPGADFWGAAWGLFLSASESGGTVSWGSGYETELASNSTGSSYAGTAGVVSQISTAFGAGLSGSGISHLAVFPVSSPSSAPYYAVNGWQGEAAGVRFLRLCKEESITAAMVGETSRTQQMGAQQPDTLLALLEECGTAEQAVVYEQRPSLGVRMRDRTSMYNQAATLALDYLTSGHVAPPLEPVDDDQNVRNDVTIKRRDGASARMVLASGALSLAAPPSGVGRYDESVTLNLAADTQCAPLAGWRLHLRTWDEQRYPQIRVNLAAAPSLIASAVAVDVGDRLTISNPPAWLPPDQISQLVQGYTETIGLYDWDLEFNCTPEGPWRVAVIDDAALGRLDTGGSQLASSATSTATSLSVATTTGPTWTTALADTPFDVQVAGEVMTVAAVGTLLNDNAFFLTDLTGWSTQASTIARSTSVVNTGAGGTASVQVTPDGVAASGGVLSAMTSVGTVTPGATYYATMWAYSPGGWSDLRPVIDWYDASGTFLSTGLGSATAVPAGAWTFIQQTLTAPASASRARVRGRHGGTPPSSALWYAWALRLVPTASVSSTSPQAMTVIRSVNGIVKAQSSGADVRLSQPMYLAL